MTKFENVVVKLGGRDQVKFKIYESARAAINDYINQAVEGEAIKNPRERDLCERALLAAAIEKANEDGTRVVTGSHVKIGWQENLSISDTICVPWYTCARRSVIQREDSLSDKSEVFRSLTPDAVDRG